MIFEDVQPCVLLIIQVCGRCLNLSIITSEYHKIRMQHIINHLKEQTQITIS